MVIYFLRVREKFAFIQLIWTVRVTLQDFGAAINTYVCVYVCVCISALQPQ